LSVDENFYVTARNAGVPAATGTGSP